MITEDAHRGGWMSLLGLFMTLAVGLAADGRGEPPGRGWKSTRPGANGVVELTPCDGDM